MNKVLSSLDASCSDNFLCPSLSLELKRITITLISLRMCSDETE